MMEWGYDGMHRGGGLFGGEHVFMLFAWLIPVIVIVGIVWLVVELTRRRHHVVPAGAVALTPGVIDAGSVAAAVPTTSSPALAILDERYARGEIDREEFLARRKDLGG